MSDLQINTVAALRILDNDLDVLGWDQQPRLYFIKGTDEDPYLEMVGQPIPQHPLLALLGAYDHGFRAPADALGIVLAHEVYSHLEFEEQVSKDAGFLATIDEYATSIDHGHDKSPASYRHLYYQHYVDTMPPAGELCEDHRKELRMLCGVLKDGVHFVHSRVKGSDEAPEVDVEAPEELKHSTIPSTLFQFLHGIRPIDTDNPLQVVGDMQTLNALSALPTVEKS